MTAGKVRGFLLTVTSTGSALVLGAVLIRLAVRP